MTEDEKLQLKQQQLDFQRKNIALFQDLAQGQARMKELLLEILHHHGKQAMIVLVIVFLSGIVIGTQYQSWFPYLDNVVSTAKNANQLTKALQ